MCLSMIICHHLDRTKGKELFKWLLNLTDLLFEVHKMN